MLGMRYYEAPITLEYYEDKCVGCGACSVVCPHAVFAMNGKKAVLIDKGACMECGACQLNCPTQAIYVKAGVGCAAAVLNSTIGSAGCDCDCSLDDYDCGGGGNNSACC
jgi:NAD-dependent dihydropyrimidine dehydrogenase PreA subunit